jgi:hypothetical protein
MRTLEVSAKLGESIVGTASLGPRFPAVQVGRMSPLVRTSEDAKGLLRASFLAHDVPIEISVLAAREVRATLIRTAQPLFETKLLTGVQLLRERPVLAYVPAECLADPSAKAVAGLSGTGAVGAQVARLRAEGSDVQFWKGVFAQGLYRKWIYEVAAAAGSIRASLVAAPVPVVTRDQPDSPSAQHEANALFARIWSSDPTLRSVGPLYSLHLHPSAFRDTEVLQRALKALDMAMSVDDVPFWGVHVDVTDLGTITTGGGQQVQIAGDFFREVTRITEGAGLFTWLNNVGPAGPALLDRGFAFTSYTPGMTPRRAFLDGFRRTDGDTLFGKVLGGLWDYNLHPRRAVVHLKWSLQETGGRFHHVVPVELRDAATRYRIEFAKPFNCAIAEQHNEYRERELAVRNEPSPGRAVIGRSSDATILPWAT